MTNNSLINFTLLGAFSFAIISCEKNSSNSSDKDVQKTPSPSPSPANINVNKEFIFGDIFFPSINNQLLQVVSNDEAPLFGKFFQYSINNTFEIDLSNIKDFGNDQKFLIEITSKEPKQLICEVRADIIGNDAEGSINVLSSIEKGKFEIDEVNDPCAKIMGQKLTFKNNKNSLTIHLSNGTFGTLYPESAKPIDNDENHVFSESLKSIWNIGTKIDGEEQEEYFYQLDLSSLNSGKDQKIKFSLIKDQKDDEDFDDEFDDEFKELLNCEIEGDVTIFQPSAGGFAAKKITATNDFDTDLFKTQLEADDFCKEKLFVEENHSFIFSYIQNENVLKILGSKNLDLLIFTKK